MKYSPSSILTFNNDSSFLQANTRPIKCNYQREEPIKGKARVEEGCLLYLEDFRPVFCVRTRITFLPGCCHLVLDWLNVRPFDPLLLTHLTLQGSLGMLKNLGDVDDHSSVDDQTLKNVG